VVNDPPVEGKIHCPQCRNEFEDYEEWVRRCRAAAWAATRTPPPVPEPPPPRPPHLMLFAGGLFAMAALYGIAGAALLRAELRIPAIALAVLQAVAGVALLAEWRRADAVVRLAAGLSALMPLYSLTVVCFAGLFGLFSRPLATKYFGSRVDPAPDRVRHPLIAWVLVSVVVLAALFLLIVPDIVDVARAWGDVLWGDRILGFFAAHALWAPAGVIGGMVVLALWAKVNRAGFVIVSVLSILGVWTVLLPPVVEAWVYDRSVREALTYVGERDVQRLLWGVRDPDPKIRAASLLGMEETGWSARVAVPAILRTFKDDDPRVRFSAACALAQFEPSTEGVLELLLAKLEEPRLTPDTAARAAIAVGHYGPRARPALARLLEQLRKGDAATVALVEMGPASIPGLAEALQDNSPKVRRRAAKALRCMGPSARSAVPVLMERLKDSDGGSRAEAALALGEIHREKAIPLLRPLLTEDPATAKAAAEALCALGQREAMALLPQGSSSMNALRQPAIWDHLSRAVIDKDVEGTGTEILVELAERAVTCADVSPDAHQPSLSAFRRIHAASRKRSVLEVLISLEVDFVLESDRIRILSPEQASAFWVEWLAETRKKQP
jgi:HEAT repeat protein